MISAVLIVKNEQGVLKRCLTSLEGVDEIVVLDTGSYDETVDIARSFPHVKVERTEAVRPFHFAEARNRATALATQDWVLSIDADEVLRKGSLEVLRKAISDNAEATAILCTFINQSAEGKRTMQTMKKKVFRRDSWKWRYRVHEQLEALKEPVVVGAPEVAIGHFPEEDKTRRHGQNVELLRLLIQENPEYLRGFRHLGQELMLRGEYDEALGHLAKYVDATDEDAVERSQAVCYMATCFVKKGNIDQAVKLYDRAYQMSPNRREPLFWGARVLYEASRFDEAMRWLEQCIAVPVSVRPGSPLDEDGIWGTEPQDVLRIIRRQVKQAKAKVRAQRRR